MSGSGKALVGQAGVKYGLVKTGPKKPAAAAPAQPRPNVFGDDDSDEEDIGAQVARQQVKKLTAKKVQDILETALAEDPNAFDYDGVYDEIQITRNQGRQQDKIERQSKYIAQLKEQAEARKRVEDVRFERRLLKERAVEDHMYEGKEKFVTSAYRKKLEEDKLWMEQQKIKDAQDEKNDVRKIGHMGNFYSNLLTKNVAMGASTTQQKETDKTEDAAHTTKTSREASPTDAPATAPLPAAAAGKGPVLDKYELLRIEAERTRKAQRGAEAQQSTSPIADAGTAVGEAAAQQEPTGANNSAGAREGSVPQGDTQLVGAGKTTAADSQPVVTGKRRNDDESIMSAKERFLARKRQAQATT